MTNIESFYESFYESLPEVALMRVINGNQMLSPKSKKQTVPD